MLWSNLKKSLYLYAIAAILIISYELILYSIGQNFFKDQAKGSLIYDKHGNIKGSTLFAQNFRSGRYFFGRLNFEATNNCDVAIYSPLFRAEINEKYNKLQNPVDAIMITHSASLLDPYITRREALSQSKQIANARGIKHEEIVHLIDHFTLRKFEPFFDLDIVNTTLLNSYLDGMYFRSY